MNINNPKVLRAWAFYDWANSVHSLTITSAIFPIYFPIAAVMANNSKEINFFGLEMVFFLVEHQVLFQVFGKMEFGMKD
jgi:UMF1 family MFS transporter